MVGQSCATDWGGNDTFYIGVQYGVTNGHADAQAADISDHIMRSFRTSYDTGLTGLACSCVM